MFWNKKARVYQRFEKIYNEISGKTEIDTKLGKRNISICKVVGNNSFYFTYFDKDDSILFMIHILKNGDVNRVTSKINKLAILSAINEVEDILFKSNNEYVMTLSELFCRMIG